MADTLPEAWVIYFEHKAKELAPTRAFVAVSIRSQMGVIGSILKLVIEKNGDKDVERVIRQWFSLLMGTVKGVRQTCCVADLHAQTRKLVSREHLVAVGLDVGYSGLTPFSLFII